MIHARLAFLALALWALAGCDGSGPGSRTRGRRTGGGGPGTTIRDAGPADGATGQADSGSASSSPDSAGLIDGTVNLDAQASDSGASADGGAPVDASVPSIPVCRQTCVSPSDCAIAGSALHTEAHYTCAAGICEYRGCRSDQECQGALNNLAYRCRQLAGVPQPFCALSCTAASDCITANSVLHDGDNWRCAAGWCEYTGCNTSAECQSALQDSRYACQAILPSTVKSCVLTCSTRGDCALMTPLHDEDNFECRDSRCAYTGCNSTDECTRALGASNYVCQ